MKTKTIVFPALVAVFALMFVATTPYVMAEPGEKGDWNNGEEKAWKDGAKHHKKHMAVQVEGFTGSIPISEGTDRDSFRALKEQVTVSLSEAAQGLDVMKGSIGIAVNENQEKFVVWKLVSIEKDEESETATKTIYVIDAGDSSNTTQVTKEFDPLMKEKYTHGQDKTKKLDRLEQKLSEPTGDPDQDALRAQFLEKIQELRTAIESGDSDRIDELRQELKDLRTQMGNIRKF